MAETKSGPLAFGQQSYYLYDQFEDPGHPPRWNLQFELTIPREITRETLERVHYSLIERHEVLRTAFTTDSTHPIQVVHPPSPPVIAEVSLSGGSVSRIRNEHFDLQTEYPVRFLWVRGTRRLPSKIIWIYHHIALDGWSVVLLRKELRDLIEGAAGDAENRPGPSMIDLAGEQHGHAGRRQSDTALEQWARLGEKEQCVLYPGTVGDGQQFSRVTLRSPSLSAAVAHLRGSLRVLDSAIILAAYAGAVRAHCGRDRVVVLAPFANRLGRGSAKGTRMNLVGCLQQVTAIELDLGDDPPLGILSRRAFEAIAGAARHAEYDSYDWYELLSRLGFPAPYLIDGWIAYNYLSHSFQAGGDFVQGIPGDGNPATPPRWQVEKLRSAPLTALNLTIHGENGLLVPSLTFSRSAMSVEDASAFLARVEQLLIEAARPVRRDGGG
jgi:condensation domain-containing protein